MSKRYISDELVSKFINESINDNYEALKRMVDNNKPKEAIIADIVERRKDVLDRLAAYVNYEEDDNQLSIESNGITFLYNPEEITITDDIMKYLNESSIIEKEHGQDDSFCLVNDVSQGIFYY